MLGDAGIVRNRLKIAAAIENAKMFLSVREEIGSFDAYLWSFVGGKPIQNRWRNMVEVPARTAESDAMSRDLLQRGFKFVGSTICYALMQATGMVNDHLVTCPRHAELGGVRHARIATPPRCGQGRRKLKKQFPKVSASRVARTRALAGLDHRQNIPGRIFEPGDGGSVPTHDPFFVGLDIG